jgi:hypothetical protein
MAAWRLQHGKLNDGNEIEYAAGIRVSEFNGYQKIYHTGSTAGYRAWLGYYPDKKLSIVVLSNDANLGGLPEKINNIFLGEEKTKSFKDPSQFINLSENEKLGWSGIYKSIDDYDIIQLDYKDQKVLSNGHAIQALHRDTLYFDKFYWIKASADEILIKSTTQIRKYVRVTPPDLKTQSLQQLAGKYFSDEADATYLLTLEKNELTMQILPWPSQKLTPVDLNGFRDEDSNYYEFKKNKKGNITLEVSTGRALKVPFKKID